MTRPARIVLVDDHPIVLLGLRNLLSGEPGLEIVAEASSGLAALRVIRDVNPDLAVMDISLPDVNGIVVAERLRDAGCRVRIVTLTVHEERAYVIRAFEAGINGYVLKCSIAGTLIPAIHAVLAGHDYVDPAIRPRIVAPISPKQECSDPPHSRDPLTEREEQVLRLIARGYSNKETATRLDLSIKSVETYKARGVTKLGLRTRAEIMRFGLSRDWLAEV